jgi:hypothetical protein
MPHNLRSLIVERIIEGLPVEAAYMDASDQVADYIYDAVQNGKTVEAGDLLGVAPTVFENLRFSPSFREGMRIILTGGGVTDIPNAACVAEKLKGKINPSRQDIEDAFLACSP